MSLPEAAHESVEVPAVFARALRELGLADERPLFGAPLTGGVSSDIWRIDTAGGPVCAKRALARLRVAADWQAPIERNRYEARWIQVADAAVPGCTPRVLGQHAALGVLVMSYLPPERYRLWKAALRGGEAEVETARAVGRALAGIHGWSAARPALAAEFDAEAIFFDIRLEPYLLATAARHEDLRPRLEALVGQTQSHRLALVHGDVSPKNILVGSEGPVFLDAECACWGDPAFDLAFCLNHLLLKCLWTPRASAAFLACFEVLADAYLAAAGWEPRSALEGRVAALLPGLLLARVDGKSPVEYVSEEALRELVRGVARPLLREPPAHLREVAVAWREAIGR